MTQNSPTAIDLHNINRSDLEKLPSKQQLDIIIRGFVHTVNTRDLDPSIAPALDYIAPGALIEPLLDHDSPQGLGTPEDRFAMYRQLVSEYPDYHLHIDKIDITIDDQDRKATAFIYAKTTGVGSVAISRVGIHEFARFGEGNGRWMCTRWTGLRGLDVDAGESGI